jgi:hypothetical protein
LFFMTARLRIDAVNRALAGIPEDRMLSATGQFRLTMGV